MTDEEWLDKYFEQHRRALNDFIDKAIVVGKEYKEKQDAEFEHILSQLMEKRGG